VDACRFEDVLRRACTGTDPEDTVVMLTEALLWVSLLGGD